MSALTRFFHSVAAELERDIDLADDLLSQGEGYDRKVRILAYAGFRNATCAKVKGRIVRYEEPLDPGDSMLPRVRAMAKIYISNELPNIAVRCSGYGQTLDALTDEEGYFHFELATDRSQPARTAWEKISLTTPGREAQQDVLEVPILAPGTDDNWGIISDIDDTVVETGATNFLKNWRRVLLERPQDRLAVPGASTLYTTIARDHKAPSRPFFYVSSSPWNLYDFIADFMELNGIPHGPMFLKDYGVSRDQLFDKGHDEHKLTAIEAVLAFYPERRFLLIGDNGQRDVTIYSKVVQDFGTRIGAVFIRDVDGSCRSGPEGALLRQIEATGVPTFCGSSFADAVSVVRDLNLDRPLEVASAVLTTCS